MKTPVLLLLGLVGVLAMDVLLKSLDAIRVVVFSAFLLLATLHVFKKLSFKESSSTDAIILSRELHTATTSKIRSGATKITPIKVSVSPEELEFPSQTPFKQDSSPNSLPDLPRSMPTTRQILFYMFTPDLYDWILFLAAFPLTYYLVLIPLHAPVNHPSFLSFLGVMMLALYASRWGYTSVFSFLRELENEMRYFEENIEAKQIVNFKAIGILVSIAFIALGIQLSNLPPSIRS